MTLISGCIEMAEKVDMNPYLSGGLCRMTKQAAACRWSTHGSQSDNRSDLILALHHPAFLHCAHQRQNANSHCKCTPLYFVQCATVLSLWEYFILLFWGAWTCAQFLPLRIAQISSLNMVLHPLSACCSFVALLHWYFTAALVLSRCSALVLTAPHCRLNLSDARSGNTQHCTPLFNFYHLHIFCLLPDQLLRSAYDWTYDRLQPAVHIFNHLSCCLPVNNIECKNAIHRIERIIIGGNLRIEKSI